MIGIVPSLESAQEVAGLIVEVAAAGNTEGSRHFLLIHTYT